jgi:hypothetical protein
VPEAKFCEVLLACLPEGLALLWGVNLSKTNNDVVLIRSVLASSGQGVAVRYGDDKADDG